MKKRENETAQKKNLFYLRQIRIMKLTFLFILLTCLQVSAKTYSQDKITVHLQSAELKKALNVIERKSNYHFLYNEAVIANKPKIDLNVKDADINLVLEKILTGNGIGYRILNNNLIVLKAENANDNAVIQDIRITGQVTGTGGVALSGVSVTIKGTNTGTVTDAGGNYSISVPDETTVLIFSYVGYGTQEVTVGNRTTINIAMVGTASQMDNVVVVGYGTQRKIDVTGSVAQIKGEEISKQPSQNPISSLQGKIAGVQITNSGAPGASPEIRIRGIGSVYGDPSPLYVVDGVWYTDISFLNPADIDNISILKDASSLAIYGVQAANGVVLITTKKGRPGKASVSYNGYVGMQHVTNQIQMANANEYATLINELSAVNGSGQVLNPSNFSTGTDWYHQILRNALVTNHQVSISGGSERSTYNFSVGYFKQDGIVEKNSYTRFTTRLQNDFQVFKPLKLGYTITGAASNSNDIPGAIFHQLFAAAPVVPVYYADGTYGDPSDYNLGDGNNFNPQATLDFFNQKAKNYRVTGSVFADLRFARHFTFHSNIGGDFGQAELRNYNPVYTATLKQRNANSQLNINRTETRNWILENTLTYENRFNDHNIKILVGQTAQRSQVYGLAGSAKNVPNSTGGDMYLALGDLASRTISDFGDIATYSSYFGRVNYSFMSRYLLTASIRADGSSKFYGNDRWGYFPSIGLGWIITDEPFMKNQNIFNTLKLRGSWGKVGNGKVPSNISVSLLSSFPPAIFGPGTGQTYSSFSVATIVPPTVAWERGVGTDVGLEAALLKNKLYVEADFYNRKTEKAIFDIPVLYSLGTLNNTLSGNQAEIQNRGFELTVNWKSVISQNLSYSIGGNFSMNDNKVLSVTTGKNPIYGGGSAATGGQLATITVLGQPIGEFYGLQVAGVFQNAAEIASSAQAASAKAGDFKYVDQNKDGVIDGRDRVVLGNPNPKYTYGINTNWTYKEFDLTLDFQGVAKVSVYNANLGIRYGNENFTKDFYDNRWHGQGTSNTYPSANIGGGDNYRPNSFFVEDGSYFRIRNMQLGYTLPHALTDRWKMSSLRVYVNAQNAFNFFKYRGFSPEITGGSPIDKGIDTNVYPLYATYNFGINLNF